MVSDRQREKDFQETLDKVTDEQLASICTNTKRTCKENSGTEDGRIAGIFHRLARNETKKRKNQPKVTL